MRCIASALFLVAHGLLVLEHITIGTALHGIAELFLAPWALRHKAWDIIVIGLIFCVFDLWGTLRLTGALVSEPLSCWDQKPKSCHDDQRNIPRNTQFSQAGRRSFSNISQDSEKATPDLIGAASQ